MIKHKNLKVNLKKIISEMAQDARSFSKRPGKDFSRNSKLNFEKTVSILLAMHGKSISKELLKFFNYKKDIPDVSSFVKSKEKLAPHTLQTLFKRFVSVCEDCLLETYKSFRLLAVDGSDFQIPQNKKSLHLNALYDIQNRFYVEAIAANLTDCDERSALLQMLRCSDIKSAILLADRGYEGYNMLTQIQEKGWKYLVRVRDGVKGIVQGLDIPETEEFDVDFNVKLTRHGDKFLKKYICSKKKADGVDFLNFSFRLVRFKISDRKIETVITNLDRGNFSPEELKKLYNMRWGIETSFRDLKHTIGAIKFHSKKEEQARHEIFAGLIMYNFSALISSKAELKIGRRQRKYEYKASFSEAVAICKEYFLGKIKLTDAEVLIGKFIIPVRNGRSYERKKHPKKKVSFTYR